MRPSPPRQNIPKATYGSPLGGGSKLATDRAGAIPAKGSRAPAQAVGRSVAKPARAAQTPTHMAFVQTPAVSSSSPAFSGFGGAASSPTSGRPLQFGANSQAESSRPALRQGAPLYGALDALQAATKSLGLINEPTAEVGKSGYEQPTRKSGTASMTPEELWKSIPSGGEAAWRSSGVQRPSRLHVARLQEALSEAAAGLQRAMEATRGSLEDEEAWREAATGNPGPSAALRRECAVLEAESKELEEEKAFLDARMVEVKQELARLQESQEMMQMEEDLSSKKVFLDAPSPAPSGKRSHTEDVSELAVVLRLLACLKDVALGNRSVILPSDPSKWTREQQVVAYFLDEVEACSARI